MTLSPELLTELQPVLAEMVRESIKNIGPSIIVPPSYLPAFVLSTNTDGTAEVLPDTSSDSITVQSRVGRPTVGARVMLQFSHPSGIFIIGYCGDQAGGARIGGEWTKTALTGIASGGVTAITFDTEVDASDFFISTPGTTIAIPTGLGGVWMTAGMLNLAGGVGANRAFLEVQASSYTDTYRQPFGNGENLATCGGPFILSDRDTLGLNVFQSSGGAINCSDARLIAWRLGN